MGYIEKGRATTFTKIVLWLIVVSFVAAIFVMWGAQQAGMNFSSSIFTVNGNTVDSKELSLNQAFYQFMQERLISRENLEDFYVWNAASIQIGSRLGGGLFQALQEKMQQDDQTQHLMQTIAMMIGDIVLADEAGKAGIRVTDMEVAKILADTYRDPDGKFLGADVFEHDLQRYNIGSDSEPRFKQLLKRHLMARHYVSSLYAAVQPGLKSQARQIFEAQNRTIDFSFAKIDAVSFISQLAYTDADLQTYLGAHLDEFVVADMLLFDKTLYAASLQISDADIATYYNEHKEDEYTQPESRDVRRILIKVAENADAATLTAAQQKIAEIYSQLARPGEEFATVARKYSEDPSVNTEDALIKGLTRTGARDEAFVNAAFAIAKEGDYNKIAARTKDGLEIVQLVKIYPGATQPLESVKSEIHTELANQRADAEAATRADELRTQSIGNDWDKLTQPAWVTVTHKVCAITGEDQLRVLGQAFTEAGHPSDVSAIFNTPEKETTSVMQVGQNYAFFKVLAKGSSLNAQFADLKPAVAARFTSVKSLEMAKAAAEKFAGQVKDAAGYEAFSAAAAADSITLQDAAVNKYEGVFTYGADLLQKASAAGAGKVIGPVERDRSFYVAFVKSVSPFDEALFAQQEPQIRLQLLNSWMQGQPNIFQFMNIVDSSFAELMEAQISHLTAAGSFSFNRGVVLAMFGVQS